MAQSTSREADFLARMDRARTIEGIKRKAANGERLTPEERKAVHADASFQMLGEIDGHIKSGRTSQAFERLAVEVVSLALGAANRADGLEDRLAALEGTKPRVRRPAGSRHLP